MKRPFSFNGDCGVEEGDEEEWRVIWCIEFIIDRVDLINLMALNCYYGGPPITFIIFW